MTETPSTTTTQTHIGDQTATVYVNHIPDLMTWEDYDAAHDQVKVRIRLTVTDDGLEIIVDSPYPIEAETILQRLGVREIEMMLCG